MTDRLPSTIASAVGAREEISLRLALPADDAAIQRLSELAEPSAVRVSCSSPRRTVSSSPPQTPDGCVISDPFRVTLDVVELLRLRAAQLRAVAA